MSKRKTVFYNLKRIMKKKTKEKENKQKETLKKRCSHEELLHSKVWYPSAALYNKACHQVVVYVKERQNTTQSEAPQYPPNSFHIDSPKGFSLLTAHSFAMVRNSDVQYTLGGYVIKLQECIK